MNLRFFLGSKYTFISMGIVCIVMIFSLYQINKKEKTLSIYNPTDINPKLIHEDLLNKSKNHTIGPFRLKNQNGCEITESTFKDKIYIACFFFTRCQDICPIMSENMSKLQKYFRNESQVMLLSHSITPQIDSVSVLKKYADTYSAIPNKWHMTTGDKTMIYELARKNYFAVLPGTNEEGEDFIHTEQFILIDKKKRIRGFYDGTKDDDIHKIIEDIELLLKTD